MLGLKSNDGRRCTGFRRWLAAAVYLSAAGAAPTYAQQPNAAELPGYEVYEVDERGIITRSSWPLQGTWHWEQEGEGAERWEWPIFHLWAQLPSKVAPVIAEGTAPFLPPRASPFSAGPSIGIQTRKKNLITKFPARVGDRETSLLFQAKLLAQGAPLWVHESCTNAGVSLKLQPAPGERLAFLYAGIFCAKFNGATRIELFFSEDLKVEPAPGDAGAKIETKGSARFQVTTVPSAKLAPARLARFVITAKGKVGALEIAQSDPVSAGGRSVSIAPEVGFTYLRYLDSRIESKHSLLLTPKLAFNVRFHRDWDVSLASFVNAWQMVSSTSLGARFIGVNLRLGYSPPWPRAPWRLGLHAGAYFLQMIVSPTPAYGFSNLFGPQLYPTFSYTFPKDHTLGLYAKYSPLGFVLNFSLNSAHEIAGGLFYGMTLAPRHRLSIHLDFAALLLEFTSGVAIQSYSLSLGTRYAFDLARW